MGDEAAPQHNQQLALAGLETRTAPRRQQSAGEEAVSQGPRWSHHSQVPVPALAPMLRHYVELKRQHPQRLLLYRLGDFYECFFEDAVTAAAMLELTLTGKEGGRAIGRVPMAGIPHHALERYATQLLRHGRSVAICDQLEATPSQGGLLRRDITRVLTPGTVLEEGMLSARRNNWLAAVLAGDNGHGPVWGLAVADVSTGEFQATQVRSSSQLNQELLRLRVAELLLPHGGDPGEGATDTEPPPWRPAGLAVGTVPRRAFQRMAATAVLQERFQLAGVSGLGLNALPLALGACGGLLHYLQDTQRGMTVPLAMPRTYSLEQHLQIDQQTHRHLELTETQRDGQWQGSLLWAIDRTLTAMGGRCLRRWLQRPLVDLRAIAARQETIAALVATPQLRQALRRVLRPMGDLERLAGRAASGAAGARDLVALADGLERLGQLAGLLRDAHGSYFQPLRHRAPALVALMETTRRTLVSSPPLSLLEGGLIQDGVDDGLDKLRQRLEEDHAWLNQLEQRERQATGIGSLRLNLHRSFGYYISISKSRSHQAPERYIRRQTLANEERFVTPELKDREGRILSLRSRTAQREYDLFCALRQQVGEQAGPIRRHAAAVAALDALVGLAELAATHNYCRPRMDGSRAMAITAGRHPVVEQNLVQGAFVANHLALGQAQGADLIILTGPNASGKSCYLRQTGLLQLLAQMGSYVPATAARLGLCDRIFSRVGTVDDLAAGQSTFMVEMSETANILHHATDRSLVLLDEIGRGTATFDGLAIAWAVAEDLATRLGSRTVFATHYHELNHLARRLPNVTNHQVVVVEENDKLVFLHQVRPGGADRSYGIEAARLAGIPNSVVLRARQVLSTIEANSHLGVEPMEVPLQGK
ncbi:MAG: DNA mismatch repair protein MutS [Cyanobacteria bacterium MAG CAR3_bin_5]|nr:DNA mismatch repair protein MutS [Cyanobacteria bacterium MAG CAR3_bin_5]